jgi:hypothetical protein
MARPGRKAIVRGAIEKPRRKLHRTPRWMVAPGAPVVVAQDLQWDAAEELAAAHKTRVRRLRLLRRRPPALKAAGGAQRINHARDGGQLARQFG